MRYTLIFGTLLLISCGIEKQDLKDSDPIFKNEENVVVSVKLKNTNIKIPAQQTLLNWFYADYSSEISNINHYFAGEFKVQNKINFGSSSKNRYGHTSMPIIIDNTMYICNGRGTLIAFDLNTNKEIWSKSMYELGRNFFSFTSFLTAHLSYGDNKIFMATNDGFVIAIDINTHQGLWIKNLKYPLRSAFKYSNNTLYGVSANNKVFAIDPKNGEILWKYDHIDTQKVTIEKPSVLILDNKIVVGFSTADAIAFDGKNGTILWTSEVNYRDGDNLFRLIDINITPAKVGDYVMVGGINGNVQFIKPDNGQIVSGYLGSLASSVVSSEDFAFFMDSEAHLICLHIPTGGIKWSTQFKHHDSFAIPSYLNSGKNRINIGFEYGGPIFINNKIVLLNQFGDLFIINPENGEVEKTIKIPKDVHKNPVVVNGKIYLIDDFVGHVLIM